MTGSCMSPNMAYTETLWRRFVACDPELSALEREKAENERRHAERRKTRQKAAKRPMA